MKKYSLFVIGFMISVQQVAQVPYNNAVPNGYTKKAVISEQVGLTQVTITYHRPAVKGREGKIWGGIVHKGFIDQGFGSGNPAPWRAGANENTIIEIDHDIKVEGQVLPKGKYGFFIAFDSLESTIIFSKRSDAWGSFFYSSGEDVLRIKVRPKAIPNSVEFLKYEFMEQTQNAAVIALLWEKLMISFKVEVDYLKQQFQAFVTESQNPRGFTSQSLNLAASWCLQNDYELEKALVWAMLATGPVFPGDPSSFPALVTKAGILEKLGKNVEAAAVIKTAMPFGSINQLQQLGRQLIAGKKPREALEVFMFNHNKNPNHFITLVGMMRGLSANGEYAKALDFAKTALTLAPNESGKQQLQSFIDKLQAGKDIN